MEHNSYMMSREQEQSLAMAIAKVSPLRAMSHPEYEAEFNKIADRVLGFLKRKYPTKQLNEYAQEALAVTMKEADKSKKLKEILTRLKIGYVAMISNKAEGNGATPPVTGELRYVKSGKLLEERDSRGEEL